MRLNPLLVLLLLPSLSIPILAQPVTTGTLIKEMVDLRRLTEFPDPAYKTVQFSSYDRRSNAPGGPEWFANSDGFGQEPVPNFEAVLKKGSGAKNFGEYLVCDLQGPGAIVRQWTARIEGTVRMYLDGAETPVYDGRADRFFMRIYDEYLEEQGLESAVLADTLYQRNAGYCPIPFAKRCRIIWTGNTDRLHFYAIQVRLYEADTEVRSFSPTDLKEFAADFKQTAKCLRDPDAHWNYASERPEEAFSVVLKPGESIEAYAIEGSRCLERLALRVDASDRDAALRQTILHVHCDGYPWGQVQSPIGDFFGVAPGLNPYQSLPFTVSPDGLMTSRFPMPCAEELRIRFQNLGEQTVTVQGAVLVDDYEWNDDRSMHFRARWRIDHDLVGSNTAPQDLPYLIAHGAGVYVGSVAYILNPNEIPSSGGNWWGEGDEKIFVDNDTLPSTFGTGSEDYYNYAWSARDIFVFPYCGQPRNDGPANRGFVTNYRWHVLDPLPFQQRLSFYMELFTHETTPKMAYGRIGFYYARPGLMDDHVAITGEDVRIQRLPLGWTPKARGAAQNSLFFEGAELRPAKGRFEIEEDALWSEGKLLRWYPEKVGDTLQLHFSLPEKNRYVVRLGLAHDPRSGKLSVQLDDSPKPFFEHSEQIDLFCPHQHRLRIDGMRRPVDLAAGDHSLTLCYKGGAPDGSPPSIGVDFIMVQQQK